MSIHGTITLRTRQCDNDTAEGINTEAVRQWKDLANQLRARVEYSNETRVGISSASVKLVTDLHRSIKAALMYEETFIVGPCGYEAPDVEGEVVSGTTAGWSEQWRCPRCGRDNVDSFDAEDTL